MTGPRIIDVREATRAEDATRAAATLDSVLEHLSQGGLLAYPTETVYGFGGIPTRQVIEGLAALKTRGPAKSMLAAMAGDLAESRRRFDQMGVSGWEAYARSIEARPSA